MQGWPFLARAPDRIEAQAGCPLPMAKATGPNYTHGTRQPIGSGTPQIEQHLHDSRAFAAGSRAVSQGTRAEPSPSKPTKGRARPARSGGSWAQTVWTARIFAWP